MQACTPGGSQLTVAEIAERCRGVAQMQESRVQERSGGGGPRAERRIA